MTITKPQSQPEELPLLSAQEKAEMEEVAQILLDFSRVAWGLAGAQGNLIAAPSSTNSQDPRVHVQDGEFEEHVSSGGASLEDTGDAGHSEEGEESDKWTVPLMIQARTLARLNRRRGPPAPGESYLNPLLIEECEPESAGPPLIPPLIEVRESKSKSKSEGEPCCIHPSSAPEGTLLRAMSLLLLAAGTEGMTVRKLYNSLTEPATALGFEEKWKLQVQSHLKTNPYFRQAEGLHFLLGSDDHLEEQQPNFKSSNANIASTSRRNGASSSKTVPSYHQLDLARVHQDPPVDAHSGVRNRRKAFEKANEAITDHAMEEAIMEFEEMTQSMGDMPMPFQVAARADSQQSPSTKRKSSASEVEELAHHGQPITGGLTASQVQNLALQQGSAKENKTGNVGCTSMANAGDTL